MLKLSGNYCSLFVDYRNMIKSLNNRFKNSRPSSSITSAAFIISAAGVLSRVLGMARDRILAHQFGAGDTLDVYYAAFRIPDLIYNLLILGALSAAFIPVFTSLLAEENKKEAWRLANGMLSAIVLTLVTISLILIIFTPALMRLVTPGFSADKMEQVILLTRIMFLSPIFLSISGLFGGILNSFKRFLVYSMAPVMYNIGIIIGAVLFVKYWGVTGLAWGVALGAFLHMAIQYPAVKISGFRYKFCLDFKNSHFRKVIRLMIPRALSLTMNQINLLVVTIIASTLAAGSLAVFNFANNLQAFPLGIFGIPFALAIFPTLSHFAAKKEKHKFVKSFSKTFRQILFLVVPASVLMLVLRAQIVRVVLGTGRFDWEDTTLTFQCLGLFAISLFAQSLVPLLARSFFALHNTRTPFYAGLVSGGVNLILALVLARYMGVLGLALALSVANILNMFLLMFILHLKLKGLDDKNILTSTVKIAFSALVAGLIAQLSKYAIHPFINLDTFLGVFAQMSFCVAAGLITYLLFSQLFNLEEYHSVRKFITAKIFRTKQTIPEDPTEASGI